MERKIQGVNYLNKTRIHELAKELGLSSKDLINLAKDINIDVQNHMSSLENEEVATLKNHYAKKNAPAQTTGAAAAPVQNNSMVNHTDAPKQARKPAAQNAVPQNAVPQPAKTQPARPANTQSAAQPNRQVPPQGVKPVTPNSAAPKSVAPKSVAPKPAPSQQGRTSPAGTAAPQTNNTQRTNPPAQKAPTTFLRPNTNQPRPANQQVNKTEPKKESVQELDEDNVRVVSNKEEIKKVERIGKKPQNNKQPFRPQHRNNRNFRSKDTPPVKREEIVSKNQSKLVTQYR